MRRDFDGLISRILLNYLDMIEEVVFVHPMALQGERSQACFIWVRMKLGL